MCLKSPGVLQLERTLVRWISPTLAVQGETEGCCGVGRWRGPESPDGRVRPKPSVLADGRQAICWGEAALESCGQLPFC